MPVVDLLLEIKSFIMAADYDFLFKVLFVGDSGVGKSALLRRFCDNEYSEEYTATIGVDFKIKTLLVDNHTIKLQVWDTAGQERFNSLIRAYFRGAHGIFMVVDVTDEDTLLQVSKHWMTMIHEEADMEPSIVMLVNKADLQSQAKITQKQLDRLLIPHFKTSAKSGLNVRESFEMMAREILKKRRLFPSGAVKKESVNGIRLNAEGKQEAPNNGCFC